MTLQHIMGQVETILSYFHGLKFQSLPGGNIISLRKLFVGPGGLVFISLPSPFPFHELNLKSLHIWRRPARKYHITHKIVCGAGWSVNPGWSCFYVFSSPSPFDFHG